MKKTKKAPKAKPAQSPVYTAFAVEVLQPMTGRELLRFLCKLHKGGANRLLDGPVAMMSDAEGNHCNCLGYVETDTLGTDTTIVLWPR